MSRPDISDEALFDAFEDVRNDKTATNWVLYGYVPRTSKIRIDAQGEGTDIYDMTDNMSDGKIHYGFFRFNVNGVFKFVYIAWCGEGVSGMKRGTFNSHAVFMSKFLDGYHVQINARTEEDLDEDEIRNKLKSATASHGRRNLKAREQSTESTAAASTSDAGIAYGQNKADSGEFTKEAGTSISDAGISYGGSKADSGEYTKEAVAHTSDAGIAYGGSKADSGEYASTPVGYGAETGYGADTGYNQAPAQSAPPARSAPPPARSAPPPARAAPPPAQSYDDQSGGYDDQSGGYDDQSGGYDDQSGGYDDQSGGYDDQSGGYDDQSGGYDDQSGGYDDQSGGYDDQSGGYDDQSGGFADSGAAAAGPTCTAQYDYAGENDGDLAFSAGDVITVLDESDPSGWWQGELNGVTGYFPSNFVQKD